MGNRAVITTRQNFDNNGIGIYLHWNGGRDSVEAFLKYCEMKGYRPPDSDNYGWARLCQVICNFFGGGLSVGIDTVDCLDCDNYDNGTYFIEGWKIVGREYFDGIEQNEYPLDEMLEAIDERMPEEERFGKEYLHSEVVAISEIKYGDIISYIDYNGKVVTAQVVGFGEVGAVRNGQDVTGIPYIALHDHNGDYSWNINNYLTRERVYRRLK